MSLKLKTTNENKVNLKSKNNAELQELIMRQNNILNNKLFVNKLPDKGEKVKQLYSQLEAELNKRLVHEKLCKDLSSLNINKDQLDTLEWTGKHVPCVSSKNNQLDIDNNDENVLKMFASHSGVHQDKIIIKQKPEELLIKPSDLVEENLTVKDIQQIDESKEFPENMEIYAKKLCGRIDTNLPTKKKHILLNKPAKPNKYSTVKSGVVSLKESVTLQFSNENKLKELQTEKIKNRPNLNFKTNSYRESNVFKFVDTLEDSDESSDTNNIFNNDDDNVED